MFILEDAGRALVDSDFASGAVTLGWAAQQHPQHPFLLSLRSGLGVTLAARVTTRNTSSRELLEMPNSRTGVSLDSSHSTNRDSADTDTPSRTAPSLVPELMACPLMTGTTGTAVVIEVGFLLEKLLSTGAAIVVFSF